MEKKKVPMKEKMTILDYLTQPFIIVFSQTFTSIAVGIWTYFFGSNYTDVSSSGLPGWLMLIIMVGNILFMIFVLYNSFRKDVKYYNYFESFMNDKKLFVCFTINIILQVYFLIAAANRGHQYGTVDMIMLIGYIVMSVMLVVLGFRKTKENSK